MSSKLSPVCWIATALLAACAATQTPYQPLANGVGYAEQKLQTGRYRVSYAGSPQTPRGTVENYLLYRAAELTLANGYDWFMFADKATDAETRYDQRLHTMGGYGWYGWYPYGDVVSTSRPVTEFQAQADVVMLKGAKPADDARGFDAREVKENLGPTIVRREQ